MESIPDIDCTERESAAIFAAAWSGTAATADQVAKFGWFMILFFDRLDAKRNWCKQLLLRVLRNNNGRLLRQLGTDASVDSIGDFPQARGLSRYLDQLDGDEKLPKMGLYNLNPAHNYVFATMIGIFRMAACQARFSSAQDGGSLIRRMVWNGSSSTFPARTVVAFRRHAHRFTQLPALCPPRVLPPIAVFHDRCRCRVWADSGEPSHGWGGTIKDI